MNNRTIKTLNIAAIISSVMVLGLLLSNLSWASASPKLQHWQDKRYIENSFYDIVMRAEFEQVRPVIRKWSRPLRIWIHSSAGDAEEQRWLLAMHFHQIGQITKLPVEFVQKPEQANVRIYFADERHAARIAHHEMSPVAVKQLNNSVCIGHIRYNRWAQITRGTVIIPVERAQNQGKLMPCVVEEVTQLLGLINDSKRFYPTVFSDITDDELLTGLDYVLLRLLYSPEMRSGMTISQARPVIRRILEQWERTGVIRDAERAVSLGPLYAKQ